MTQTNDFAVPPGKPKTSGPIAAAAIVVGLAIAIAAVVFISRNRQYLPVLTVAPVSITQPATLVEASASPRTLTPYEGLGTWIDAFDFSPAYDATFVMPNELDAMAANGVKTIFVQSGRLDSRSPELLEDRWVLADLIIGAHQRDIDVVAWFLPKWTDETADLQHLVAASEFEVLGHRFDGVAVDIEWNQDGLDPVERSARLVRLSQRFDDINGEDPVGAIVMPPILLEVINDQFWPDFPWTQIADHYDVWLPMSYWSLRSDESGYGRGYQYNLENSERIRTNTGLPNAPIHGIGGIGGTAGERDFSVAEVIAAIEDLELFAQSLTDSDSIGGSIYDWRTLDDPSRQLLNELFATGVASNLPSAG